MSFSNLKCQQTYVVCCCGGQLILNDRPIEKACCPAGRIQYFLRRFAIELQVYGIEWKKRIWSLEWNSWILKLSVLILKIYRQLRGSSAEGRDFLWGNSTFSTTTPCILMIKGSKYSQYSNLQTEIFRFWNKGSDFSKFSFDCRNLTKTDIDGGVPWAEKFINKKTEDPP